MALEIQPTPDLYGEDAIRFERIIQENAEKSVDPEEVTRIRESYELVRSMAADKSLFPPLPEQPKQ